MASNPEGSGPSETQPSALPIELVISIFPDLAAKKCQEVTVSWGDLPKFLVEDKERFAEDKKALRLFIPGQFDGTKTAKGAVRHDQGLTSLFALVIDYDEGKIPLEAAAEIFSDVGCPVVLAPTASWAKDLHKWRAVIPLSRKYSTAAGDDLKALHRQWVAAVRSWGIPASGETDTLSQSYYFGTPLGKMAPAPISVPGRRFLDRLPSVAPNTTDQPKNKSFVDADESQQLLEVISTGAAGVHEAMRRLSMAWVTRGLDPTTVKVLLKQALDKWGDASNARWAERRAGVDRLVDGAARRVLLDRLDDNGGEEADKEAVSVLAEKLPSVADALPSKAEMDLEPEPDRMVVAGYMIAAESGGMVAPGGTGKTTLAIWEAVHVVLGEPLYGLEIETPGPIVFISAEDRRDVVLKRLNLIMRAMDLTKAQWRRVCENFLVIDVSRMRFRLASRGKYDVHPTAWVDALAERYGSLKPSYFHLDPVSLIGPGEESGNDGMAELMRASRNLGSLTGAAVRMVHHTSKEGARNNVSDQYVGRGGSAFADNARFIHQLMKMPANGTEEITVSGVRYMVPPELCPTDTDFMRGRVLGLFRHKLSYSELDPTPIFLKRDGFKFDWAMGVPEVSEEGRAMAEIRTAEARSGLAVRFISYLETFGDGGVLRRRAVKVDFRQYGATARDAEPLLEEMLSAGRVEEFDVPTATSRGRPAKFLRAVTS